MQEVLECLVTYSDQVRHWHWLVLYITWNMVKPELKVQTLFSNKAMMKSWFNEVKLSSLDKWVEFFWRAFPPFVVTKLCISNAFCVYILHWLGLLFPPCSILTNTPRKFYSITCVTYSWPPWGQGRMVAPRTLGSVKQQQFPPLGPWPSGGQISFCGEENEEILQPKGKEVQKCKEIQCWVNGKILGGRVPAGKQGLWSSLLTVTSYAC